MTESTRPTPSKGRSATRRPEATSSKTAAPETVSAPPAAPLEAKAPIARSPAAKAADSGPIGAPPQRNWRDRKRVLVLQGGGALGSYQAGVCEGLSREAMGPSWVAGISIGAINAALIVGNPPEERDSKMRLFWERASSGGFSLPLATGDTMGRAVANNLSAASIATFGAPGFFRPRFPGPLLAAPETPEALSFYDTEPLRQTLEELVDFDRINNGHIRFSVGAVDIETGNNVLFDNTKMVIGPEHIMASGALPPGFPPIWIEGRAYWDGGLVSNTPLEFVLDEETREDLLIFQVDLFSARGPMPRNLLDAAEREKDIRYSSRTRLNTDTNMRIHRIKMALQRLIDSLPPGHGDEKDLRLLRHAAKENAVAIVQLIYRKRAYEGGCKDYEFSRQTMLEHWASGMADVEHFFAHADTQFAAANGTGVVVIDPGLNEQSSRSDPA